VYDVVENIVGRASEGQDEKLDGTTGSGHNIICTNKIMLSRIRIHSSKE